MKSVFTSDKPFLLESGFVIPRLEIAYHTYGRLNASKDNAIWVCHALTANSDVADWWPHTVTEGGFLNPSKHFIVCANIPGSCYGSTGPLSVNPATGKPYYGEFPRLTMRDIVNALILLADALGLKSIDTLIGSSVGGFQATEWAAKEPDRFRRMVLIATAPKASPWAIAINETQRMAIEADPTFGNPSPEAGSRGLAAARAIGLLTYRGPDGYNMTQQDPVSDTAPDSHRACTYQRHQGDKLCRRFNAYSYMSILDAFDTHDTGRARGGVRNALAAVKARTLTVGISSDIIFPPEEMRSLSAMIPGAEYAEIDSRFGHDGFLVEHETLNRILNRFLH